MNRQSDLEIDRILQHLGSAEPPDGIECRVLQQLACREAITFRGHSTSARLVASSAFACLAVAALAATLSVYNHAALRTAGFTAHFNPAFEIDFPDTSSATPVSVIRAAMPSRSESQTRRSRTAAKAKQRRQEPRGFPAPEAPLTAQEKLLVRLALSPDPAAQEMLNPVLNAQLHAASDAEFDRFVHSAADTASHRSN